jgi:hypothetical protein
MAREVEQLSIFTRELFSTPHDAANRVAVAAVPAAELASSASVYGPMARSSTRYSTSCDRIHDHCFLDLVQPAVC